MAGPYKSPEHQGAACRLVCSEQTARDQTGPRLSSGLRANRPTWHGMQPLCTAAPPYMHEYIKSRTIHRCKKRFFIIPSHWKILGPPLIMSDHSVQACIIIMMMIIIIIILLLLRLRTRPDLPDNNIL